MTGTGHPWGSFTVQRRALPELRVKCKSALCHIDVPVLYLLIRNLNKALQFGCTQELSNQQAKQKKILSAFVEVLCGDIGEQQLRLESLDMVQVAGQKPENWGAGVL